MPEARFVHARESAHEHHGFLHTCSPLPGSSHIESHRTHPGFHYRRGYREIHVQY